MSKKLHFLKFAPILKERIWGGSKLNKLLNKSSQLDNIGESWEISDVEGDTSIIINGSLKGQSLKEVIKHFKAELLGSKNVDAFGDKFPILIKFIDAREDLSIQLHPNDELAAKRHNSFGKTEMWHVMQADKDAKLIVGFNKKITPETYLKHLEEKSLVNILNFEKVQTGDTYFIEVGRVHAIGAGVLLAEIQQTSDITYRVYDWDRKDANGNERELHNDLAIDAIDFNMDNDYKVNYNKDKNAVNAMVSCPYFTTNYLDINEELLKKNIHDSFLIYICVEGDAEFIAGDNKEIIEMGETILIPAIFKDFIIRSKKSKLLEVYV